MKEAEEHAVSRLKQSNQESELAQNIIIMMASNFDRWMPDADMETCGANNRSAKPVAEGIAKKLMEAMAQNPDQLNAQRWRQLVESATRNAFIEFPAGGSLIRLGQNRSFTAAVAGCTEATVAPPGSRWAHGVEKRKQACLRRQLKAMQTAHNSNNSSVVSK